MALFYVWFYYFNRKTIATVSGNQISFSKNWGRDNKKGFGGGAILVPRERNDDIEFTAACLIHCRAAVRLCSNTRKVLSELFHVQETKRLFHRLYHCICDLMNILFLWPAALLTRSRQNHHAEPPSSLPFSSRRNMTD